MYQLLSLFLCVPVVLSLRCMKAKPPNCLYNSSCSYESIECHSPSSASRGGMYCTTIIQEENEQIRVGTMDCIYDQEAKKKCSNQSRCLMKYTTEQKRFLHCCCDEHQCNLNFSLSDPEPDPTTAIPPNLCEGLSCSRTSWLVIGAIFGGVILLIFIVCVIYRNELIQSVKRCSNPSDKSMKISATSAEKLPFLPDQQQLQLEVDLQDIQIDSLIKKGRFAEIKHGFYQKRELALKVFDNSPESRNSFENEKKIYTLPFLSHDNLLQFWGYSMSSESFFYLLFPYTPIGSLKSYLIGHTIAEERDLLSLLKQISEGLHYLHRDFRNEKTLKRPPIAHRDFKSENLLVFAPLHLVICDLAMSTPIQQYHYGLNQQQQIGTPRYMSPELLEGTIGYEETSLLKCDVYALGIVFWEVLSRFQLPNVEVGRYSLPFEEQLLESNLNVHNPTVNEMNVIIHLQEPRNRPLLSWPGNGPCPLKSLELIVNILNESWQSNPDLRISSGVIFNRIHSFLSSYS